MEAQAARPDGASSLARDLVTEQVSWIVGFLVQVGTLDRRERGISAKFTDYTVTWERVSQDNLTNTGVVKFVLNKPARDYIFIHYLHVVWNP